MAKKKPSTEALKQYVRHEASRYLNQENITSVGIGFKIREGKPTDELSIQFTVDNKVAPEGLESIRAEKIPPFLTVGGVKVATDVIQRDFEVNAVEVEAYAGSNRKVAIDPVLPGASVGHRSISAGTVGCVVYDAATGNPYILSNWHVLSGSSGRLGDPIIQPGKHDDNRVERNVIGHLVRSHLGLAGDCAIASVENRGISPKIIEIDVAVARIGDPELGDRVVKSGRTTDVTHGIVNRIHVTAKIDYKGVGTKKIGCFEIGPDPSIKAPDNEITLGGDSGSAWLLANEVSASDMMVGLHFAGEVGDAPDHALACYPKSVFEKLNVVAKKPENIRIEDGGAFGYKSNFIGDELSAPIPESAEAKEDRLDVGARTSFDYMHFSLGMSEKRRFARWVAWNVDGGFMRRLSRNGISY